MTVDILPQRINVQVGASGISIDTGMSRQLPDPYEGSYVVTPSDQTQTLLTDGKSMAHNVTVNPIPSNWGRVAWNGSWLTIS